MTTNVNSLPEKLQCVRAYCLLTFYFRGMPFIDLAYLRKQDVKNGRIMYCSHKTERERVVRIAPEAAAMLEKYQNKDLKSGYLLPILDEDIKDDSELSPYYLRALNKFNCKLKKLSDLLLGGTRISSYTPRHIGLHWLSIKTFLSEKSARLWGISIKVTETYLRPFENEQIDAANDQLVLSVRKGTEEKEVA